MVKSNRFKAQLAAGGLFVLGLLAGGGLGFAAAQRHYAGVLRGGDRHELMEQHRFQALARKLDLSDEQRPRVRSVFQRHRQKRQQLVKDMLEQCGEPLRSERDQADREIRALLTAEQRSKFDRLLEKRKEWLDGMEIGPPHRRGPHADGTP